MNLVCNTMPMSVSSSYFRTFTPILIMIACLRLESTVSNNCGHTANKNGLCIDTSLHLEDSSNVQTISGMLHQLMDPRGEYSKKYRCDGCQRLNTSTKAVYVTQLSGALIVQLNIFKYIGVTNKKVISN